MFRRRRKLCDFNAEIAAHLQLEAERLQEQGLPEPEAKLAARRAFGNPTRVEERFYESRRWMPYDLLLRDLQFGLRIIAKNRGSTAIAVLTLALAIGLNTAIFSVLNAALLKDVPARNPHDLVMLSDPNASMVPGGTLKGPRSVFGYREFVRIRDNTQTMSGCMIDDAIVVMENIASYLEFGFGPIEAALRSSREIGFTVLSITVSLTPSASIPMLHKSARPCPQRPSEPTARTPSLSTRSHVALSVLRISVGHVRVPRVHRQTRERLVQAIPLLPSPHQTAQSLGCQRFHESASKISVSGVRRRSKANSLREKFI